MTKLEQAIDCVEALLQYVLQGNGSALPIGDALVDGDYLAGGLYEARELLKSKHVDAVPVVRCKDCKWKIIDDEGDLFCGFRGRYEKPDWFCADGERRERE